MKTLALDTSTRFLSIACLEDGQEKSAFHEDVGIKHSELLSLTIKGLISKLTWKVGDIDHISVGIGPGSFTGLRIAVAAVKAMTLVLGNKVSAVPTMDAIVRNYKGPERFAAPLLDARKGKVYSCTYDMKGDNPVKITDYTLTTIDELLNTLKENTIFFGDGIEVYKKELDDCPLALCDTGIDWYPKAADIGRISLQTPEYTIDDIANLNPLYLHAPVA